MSEGLSKYLEKDKDKSLNGLARYLPEGGTPGPRTTPRSRKTLTPTRVGGLFSAENRASE